MAWVHIFCVPTIFYYNVVKTFLNWKTDCFLIYIILIWTSVFVFIEGNFYPFSDT